MKTKLTSILAECMRGFTKLDMYMLFIIGLLSMIIGILLGMSSSF